MEVIKTDIEGVLIIEPKVFGDARGYFFESFSQREFDEKVVPILGHKVNFVQDNESMSSYGVMRGLHFQRPPYTQSKLVRCVRGAVLDVAVDIRKGSPTYGKHVAVELTEDNHRQFFVPRGFAHGFAVLSEKAVFQYKCDEFYHPEADGGISIIDESLDIDWKIPTDKAILSEKDTKHSLLKDFDSPFNININSYQKDIMRIFLRPISESDGPSIVRWRNDPDVLSHCLDKTHITEESNRAFYKANIETGKYKQFIVECVDSYSGVCTYPIATVYLKDMDYGNRRCELCIFTSSDVEWNPEGQTIAIKKLVEKAFNEYGMHKVYSYVFKKFPNEVDLLLNAGFTIEATLAGEARNEKGEYEDIIRLFVVNAE